MSDPFDTLRHSAPHIDGPAAQVVQSHKQDLMAYIDSQSARRRKHRWKAVGFTIPVLAVVGVSTAAAAGWLPDGVMSRFQELVSLSGNDLSLDTSRASLIAQAESGDYRVEMWKAPSDSDGDCVYLRYQWHLDAADPSENGPVGCSIVGSGDPLGALDVYALGVPALFDGESGLPAATAITGRADDPTVRSLDITFRDGRHVNIGITDPDGWFAVILPANLTEPDDNGVYQNPPAKVALLDAAGTTVATLNEWNRLDVYAAPAQD
jgi:hypothetical protein